MKKSKLNPRLNFWANILLLIGLISLIILAYLIYQRYNPQNLSFNIPAVNASSKFPAASIQPIGIQISSINLSLPVKPSEITNKKWTSSADSISYLKSSVIPGEKGNSILYGHNWPNLLGHLNKTKVGDKVNIIYSDNSVRNFEIEYLTIVSPSETSILNNSDDNRITLYTCTGFLDTKRLVAVAKLTTSQLAN